MNTIINISTFLKAIQVYLFLSQNIFAQSVSSTTTLMLFYTSLKYSSGSIVTDKRFLTQIVVSPMRKLYAFPRFYSSISQHDHHKTIIKNVSNSSHNTHSCKLKPTSTHVYQLPVNHIPKCKDASTRHTFVKSFALSLRGGCQSSTNENLNDYYIDTEFHRVYIAVGSNMGDRFKHIVKGISLLQSTSIHDVHKDIKVNYEEQSSTSPLIRLLSTSLLRETPPMYVTDQSRFLNGAIEIETILSPHALLHRLKDIESQIGRDLNNGIRNGPRPLDLDIIFYGVNNKSDTLVEKKGSTGGIVMESTKLCIPHPRMSEREFVLSPLCDLNPGLIHPLMNVTLSDLLLNLKSEADPHVDTGSEVVNTIISQDAVQVLPLPRGRMLSFHETLVMGILNVTPDSFSDGGKYKGSVDIAVEEALQMIKDGASILDIGGESTRPGAKEVDCQVEIERTIPVIEQIRKVSDIPISIDTRHAVVAKAAIEAGADIVNDVSGGTHDPLMLPTVAQLNVPIILMHMRGTPETMQSMTHYDNDNVASIVLSELFEKSTQAERMGIPRWLQVLDPGIGFAKTFDQNLSLLKNVSKIYNSIGFAPLMLGPSRKGFIGAITGETNAKDRDYGTIAACLTVCMNNMIIGDGVGSTTNIKMKPTIFRVHNVKATKQAIMVMDSIMKAK